jgi:hypothetical protein
VSQVQATKIPEKLQGKDVGERHALIDAIVDLHERGRFSGAAPFKAALRREHGLELLVRRPLWRAKP